MSGDHDLLLNYDDALIRKSDLAILKNPTAWLNDAIIHFYLTWLSHSIPPRPNVQCQFVDPSVLSYLMHQWDAEDDDPPSEILKLLHWDSTAQTDPLSQKELVQQHRTKLIFFPINDNYLSHSWHNPGGGTHWTLLLLWLPLEDDGKSAGISNGLFWHFDSCPGSGNRSSAMAVASKLALPMVHQIHECQVPRQLNGYDCGLHTLATVQALASTSWVNTASTAEPPKVEEVAGIVRNYVEISPDFCGQLRAKILKDIRGLIESK